MHFDKIVIVGTFYDKLDAQEILQYARTHLKEGGTIVPLPKEPSSTWQGLGQPGNPKQPIFPKAEPKPMKNGEVRKLPRASSPMWTTQWAAQGSAKLPYVISHRNDSNINGAVTEEGWACSCPDFTRHTPRADCKHICWVKKGEGIALSAAPVALLPRAQRETFQKFLLQQAAAGKPALPAGKTKPFITQGRRFR